jgi:hypothetical protein
MQLPRLVCPSNHFNTKTGKGNTDQSPESPLKKHAYVQQYASLKRTFVTTATVPGDLVWSSNSNIAE